MTIGNITLDNNIILAPMAGVSDLPFRLLCHEQGAGLVCMEMISAKAILYHNRNTESLLEIHPQEGPVSLQLFGSDPAIMADIAARIEDRPFQILDINMGCPVPKIVGNGEGSALMKNPLLAGQIIEAVVKAVEMAHVAQESGAAAVAVHGRTREQFYSGKADWDIIRQVKQAVSIPVIGNGDVVDGESALALLQQTGCDGIMIGRACQGNPWIFREVKNFLESGQICPRPTNREIVDTILRHARLQLQYKGEYIGIREMRKHVSWYSAGVPNSARFRAEINAMESMEELMDAVSAVFA